MNRFRNGVHLFKHTGSWNASMLGLKGMIADAVQSVNHKQDQLEIFLMQNVTKEFSDADKTIRIFVGATPYESTLGDTILATASGEYALKFMALNGAPLNVGLLTDSNGAIVAYQMESMQSYYIPFELSELDKDVFVPVIMHAINFIVDKGIAEIANQNSWKKSRSRQALIDKIRTGMTNNDFEKTRLKDSIESAERRIRELTRTLKETHDRRTKLSKELLALELTNNEDEIKRYVDGLTAIAEHPRVADVVIEDEGIVTVYVDKVYAYADDKRYYIGNMHIKININETDVRFFGDNPRDGYWGEDPHPHVDGSNGRACLGNVAESIAELCSQKEIYGLFLIALDFLENANEDDAAGEKIYMWDEVDEEGNIICEGGEREPDWTCDYCGDGMRESDDSYEVYTGHDGEGEVRFSEYWCCDCKDEHATYNDRVEEYVHDDVNYELERYYEELDREEEEEEEDGV